MKTNSGKIKIYVRPHHLICMQGFQGYGYSEEFVENMTRVIDMLKNNSSIEVELITKADNICSKCPNKINGYSEENLCSNENTIKKMDNIVLEKLGFKEGQMLIMDEAILDFVNRKVKNKKDSYDICGDCSWAEVCLWFKEAQLKF